MSSQPPIRPEYQRELAPIEALTLAESLPLFTRLFNQTWLRKSLLLLVLIGVWEIAARWQNNDLMFPGSVSYTHLTLPTIYSV